MAWPQTARHKTYSANNEITSAQLNEFQDRIIDCFEERYFWDLGLSNDVAAVGGDVQPTWVKSYDAGLGGTGAFVYKPKQTSSRGYIQLPVKSGMTITEFGAKSYFDNSVALSIKLILVDLQADSSATAPSMSTESTITPSTLSGTPVWSWDENTGLSVDVTEEVAVFATILTTNAALTDWVAGIRIKAYQNDAT